MKMKCFWKMKIFIKNPLLQRVQFLVDKCRQKFLQKKCWQNPNFNPEYEIKKIITSRPRVLEQDLEMLQNLDPDTYLNLLYIIFFCKKYYFWHVFLWKLVKCVSKNRNFVPKKDFGPKLWLKAITLLINGRSKVDGDFKKRNEVRMIRQVISPKWNWLKLVIWLTNKQAFAGGVN